MHCVFPEKGWLLKCLPNETTTGMKADLIVIHNKAVTVGFTVIGTLSVRFLK